MPPLIGQMVSHYRVLEHLGGGGMGVVYKAEDTRLKRFVALKFLPPELTRDPETKARFILEAQAASALDHPNICTIHEIDETEDGQLFIVMAYYEGETLKKKIDRGPLTVEAALDIASQVAHGLASAHEHEILHRDIKPANIMVTGDGVAKIVDFGLAKLGGQTLFTKAGSPLGTVAYMAPEQARGEPADPRTDIWALGVLLYEGITGVRPFWSEYEQALVYSILNQQPSPPSQLNAEVPEKLDAIILHALDKDPRLRYQRADEFARDLDGIRYPGTSAVPAAPSIVRRWLRAPRAIALSGVVVIAVLAAILSLVPTAALPFTEGDWIVVADFENTTGEELFDKALNTAFDVSIEQSSYLNVVPRRRLEDVLRRMKRPGDRPIDEPTAREIALREGLHLVVVPGISRIGTAYALTWRIEEARDGTTLDSGVLQAEGADEILPLLDEMCTTIRRTLGESRLSIVRRGMNLTQVTTTSIEALKQYSLGIENHWKMNFEQARVHYASALSLDSTFTAARASLGMLCYEKFDTAEGKRLLAKAIAHLDGVTEKERYGILAFHARAVENSLDEAIRYLKALLELYPDYGPAHNNLGWYHFQQGEYHKAAEEYKEAIRCDPTLYMTYSGLAWIYLYCTGEIDSALAWSKKQILRDSSQIYAFDNLGYAYAGKDSLEQALAAFRRVTELDSRYIVGLFRLSDTYRLLGRYSDAVPPLERINTLSNDEPWARYELGVLHRLMGDEKTATKYFRQYLSAVEAKTNAVPADGKNYIELGKVHARLGGGARGEALAAKGFSMDTTAHFELAQFKAAMGDNREAVHQIELAVQGGYLNYVWIRLAPDFQDLKNEPQYRLLLQRLMNN